MYTYMGWGVCTVCVFALFLKDRTEADTYVDICLVLKLKHPKMYIENCKSGKVTETNSGALRKIYR